MTFPFWFVLLHMTLFDVRATCTLKVVQVYLLFDNRLLVLLLLWLFKYIFFLTFFCFSGCPLAVTCIVLLYVAHSH